MHELPEKKDDFNPFFGQSPATWMAPGRDYVAPQSSFFFAPGIHKTSLMEYLPAKTLCDRLMEHYWRAVHVLTRTVHRPSFERQYEKMWSAITAGVEPRKSFQAMLFAALLSSAISMSEDRILTEFGVAKDGLVENFKQGTEAALAKANFLHTTRLETLQAFIMYLVGLVISLCSLPLLAFFLNIVFPQSSGMLTWTANVLSPLLSLLLLRLSSHCLTAL